jgi:hypothetical protein
MNVWVLWKTESFFSGTERPEQLPSTESVSHLQRLIQILRKYGKSDCDLGKPMAFKRFSEPLSQINMP